MSLHHNIKNHIEAEYGITFRRNSECYIDTFSKISFEIERYEWDAIKDCKDFIIRESISISLHPIYKVLHSEKIECYFNYKYLDNDTCHTDITEGGRKKYGVIAPNGKFYECRYEGHRDLEDELRIRKLIEISTDIENAFEYNGWVKLTGAWMTTCEIEFKHSITKWDYATKEDIILTTNVLTVEQIKTMKAYIKSLDRDKIMFMYQWYHIEDIDKFINMTYENMYNEEFTDLQIHNLNENDEKEELAKQNLLDKPKHINDDEDIY